MEAFGLPKNTETEKKARKQAITEATKTAIEVPLKVMKLSFESMEVLKVMAETGNPNSISDAGVGALCANTAVEGAYLNVKINAIGLEDKDFKNKVLDEAKTIQAKAKAKAEEILEIVEIKIGY
jgi:glutamate formiminotransferase / formiminotetrahydrofolate cyclodeaminase